MSSTTSAKAILKFGWEDTPKGDYLGFGWKKRLKELEQVEKSIRKEEISKSVDEIPEIDTGWREQIDNTLGLNSKDFSNREEAMKAIEREIEKEETAIGLQKDIFKEADKEAGSVINEKRDNLGKEKAQEEGWFSPGEAINIDGFYYVHSQTWYPIFNKVFGIEESLQEISEKSIECDHAAEAYGIDKESYNKIAQYLREPLQRFIAVGEKDAENKYRQEVEDELKESLGEWIDPKDAEDFIESLNKKLPGKTLDRYIKDDVEDLLEKYSESSELVIEQVGRILESKEIKTERIKKVLSEEATGFLIEKLRNMQKNLQEKARGRLINGIKDPEETSLEDTLGSPYPKYYSLSILWNQIENPSFNNIDTVHSELGKLKGKILMYRKTYTLVKKDLMDIINNLIDDDLYKKLRYWGSGKVDITFKPIFPLDGYEQARLFSSIKEGKTSISHHIFKYSYSDSKKNSEVRKRALEKLKIGDIKSYSEYNRSLEELNKLGPKRNYEKETCNLIRTTLPLSWRSIITKHTGKDADQISNTDLENLIHNKEFAEGYITQAIWDRGRVIKKGGGIEYLPKDPQTFTNGLDSVGIEYNQYKDGSIYIPEEETDSREGRLGEELREFRDLYNKVVFESS